MTRSGCDDEADGVDGIWLDGAWLSVRMEKNLFGKDLRLWSSCMSASITEKAERARISRLWVRAV